MFRGRVKQLQPAKPQGEHFGAIPLSIQLSKRGTGQKAKHSEVPSKYSAQAVSPSGWGSLLSQNQSTLAGFPHQHSRWPPGSLQAATLWGQRMKSAQLSTPKKLPSSPQVLVETGGVSCCARGRDPPVPKSLLAPHRPAGWFASPGLWSVLVCGALLSRQQEHRESRVRREEALHALLCQRWSTEHRQLCPTLPARLVLPVQPLPQLPGRGQQEKGRDGQPELRESKEHRLQLVSPQTKGTADNQEGTTQNQQPGYCSRVCPGPEHPLPICDSPVKTSRPLG